MSKQHLPALDGLRAMAVLMVIAHNVHLLEHTPHAGTVSKVVGMMMDFGWVGVTLFFVLSGYLITGILLDARGQSGALVKFLARRGLRIFPLYYALLALEFIVLPVLGAQPDLAEQNGWRQLWFWAYTVNWSGFFDPELAPTGLPHLWSLAVEEQFYLLWPLLILGVSSAKRAFMLAMGVALVSALIRAGMVIKGMDHALIYDWTITRLDALAMGGAAAALWRWPEARQWVGARRHLLSATIAMIFVVGFIATKGLGRISDAGQIWGFGIWALVCTWLVYTLASSDMGATPANWLTRLLCQPWLMRIGQVSYGMYLFHKPLHERFSEPLIKATGWPVDTPAGALGHVLIVVLVSFGLALLSYRFFESHFLRLKERFA